MKRCERCALYHLETESCVATLRAAMEAMLNVVGTRGVENRVAMLRAMVTAAEVEFVRVLG